MTNTMEQFTMQNYGKKSTFASFLPGISGIRGIPIWCYYVNRGQCVASFGVQDKDHAIMEFYPAHQAYQNVKRTGFRTFVKKNGNYLEPFSSEDKKHQMRIFMNGLVIEENDNENQVQTTVSYYTLSEEPVGALIRKLVIKNTGNEAAEFEVLDGMPALIPYGVDMNSIKGMGQTIKAWMQVVDADTKTPYFKVRASTADSASVSEVVGGNFSMAYEKSGKMLTPIVDPDMVFGYDLSLEKPIGFLEKGIDGLEKEKQVTQNQFPCSFYGTHSSLLPGEEIVMYQLIGQVESKKILNNFMLKITGSEFFEEKIRSAKQIVEELVTDITTETASKEFNAYCKYTYLDNILRGGYPMKLAGDKVFYLYSRKHGDLERDYNYFSMLPEYYSQGNGNFRDVNQNRRCDVFFSPFVGSMNIKTFYSLIQMDGYNPLAVEKVIYYLEETQADEILLEINPGDEDEIGSFLKKSFTPGALWNKLESFAGAEKAGTWFEKIIEKAHSRVNGNFGEGYWSDHWTYNLDLIENYLEVFPEKEKDLLFEEGYSYFLSQINVNPRKKRYEKTVKGIRQYHALDESSKKDTEEKLVRTDYGKGNVLYSTLLEKLILLCTTKFATLDAYGMGVEMEGGKPGWYDALNGMPGIFGSSMAESYELGRTLEYVIKIMKKYPEDLNLLEDLADFIEALNKAAMEEKDNLMGSSQVLSFWNKINDAKELYREKTYQGISGARKRMKAKDITEILNLWYVIVRAGIDKACGMVDGICPTYFTFDVTEFHESEEGIEPLLFSPVIIPLFLEGPVRFLKLSNSINEKKKLYENIKKSDLYDQKLSMYKVNASLQDASYELGRAKAFTAGWLENESIWLHMEYKYLLELLKSGLYEEFFNDFHKAAVPFLDPEVYGRSILENSSFIASSKNPNERYHGKGFVARLSGSTIEMIQMWKIMFFGTAPFASRRGELVFSLQPSIPEYLIPDDHKVSALFLGKTKVIYSMDDKKDYFPGNYKITEMELQYLDKSILVTSDDKFEGKPAIDIRDGKVREIRVRLEKTEGIE